MKDAVRQILGKTIKSVIVSEENKSSPSTQVFLLFDDDTYYEFYGSPLSGTGGVNKGGENAVMRYAEQFGGRITRFYETEGIMESAKPSQQQEPPCRHIVIKGQIWGYDDENQEVDLKTWLQTLPPGGQFKLVEG
jgi:hypothetical protein